MSTSNVAAGDIENDNFRFHHHSLRLKANDKDPFVRASYKRKIASQYFHASLSLLDNEGTCQVWEDRVLPCIALVDDRSDGSINNYADSALALAAIAGKTDASKWQSNLRKSRPVLDVVKKLTDCPNKCFEWNITDEQIVDLMGKSDEGLRLDSFDQPEAIPKLNSSKPTSAGSSSTRGDLSFDISRKHANESQNKSYVTNNLIGQNKTTLKFLDGGARSTRSIDPMKRLPTQDLNFNSNSSDGVFGRSAFRPKPEDGSGRNRGSSVMGSSDNSHSYSNNDTFRESNPSDGFNFGGQFSSRGTPAQHRNHGNFYSGKSASYVPTKNDTYSQPETGMSSTSAGFFRTAKEELTIQNQRKYGSRGGYGNSCGSLRGSSGGNATIPKRSLGTARRAGVHGKFVPPIKPSEEDDFGGMFGVKQPQMETEAGEETDERYKNIDPKMIETIRNEIMDIGAPVNWDDIAGLEFAKTTIQEMVVWPMLRPDIFTGLRKPAKGLLLFGPPGTGKTLIGKCIASQSQSTFFSISASSLTSKWIGDGEKMVRALFAVARVHQPSVVFIDEIDSLLTQRSDTEHESSRRIKTEFLVQLDGAATGEEERILIVGATNRPQELDEAARRRLVKRLYIPLPEYPARRQIVERLMSTERCSLTREQVDEIATLTEGYSGADMKNLCQEASLGPIRTLSFSAMHQITADQVRPICFDDFTAALQRVRASVSNKDLDVYMQWDKTYGMGSGL